MAQTHLALLGVSPALALSREWWWALVATALALAAIWALWLLVRPLVHRLYRWVDSLVPADLSATERPTVQVVMLALSLAVATGAGISIANTLGLDTSGLVQQLKVWGISAAKWLLPRLVRIAIIIALTLVIIRVVNRVIPVAVRRYLAHRQGETAQQAEVQKRADTLSRVLQQTVRLLAITIALFIILDEIGVNIAPVLAGAGVVGIAIGFGAQSLVRDILNGIFILLDDQFRVGDVVTIAGIGGLVEDFNLRRTVLRDLEFVAHYIPNGQITTVSNRTKERSRAVLDIQVAYKEDLERVIRILNELGEEMYRDPAFGPLMVEPLKVLRVDSFGESGITIRVIGQTQPIRQWDVMGEYRLRVKKRFDKEGIEIPFPHRTIYWGDSQEARIRHIIASLPPETREALAREQAEGEKPKDGAS